MRKTNEVLAHRHLEILPNVWRTPAFKVIKSGVCKHIKECRRVLSDNPIYVNIGS